MMAGGLSARKASSFSVRNGGTFLDEISVRNSGTFIGEITDSFCAEDGHIGVVKSDKNTSKAGCTLTCVKLGGAQFVLYDSATKQTYKLDDQVKPESFAGQEVTVTGTYDKEAKTIHVVGIRPTITDATVRDHEFF